VIAEEVDLACFGVQVEKQGVAFGVHGYGLSLIHGAEVVHAGIDGEDDVSGCIGGAEPLAVEADVHLLGGEA